MENISVHISIWRFKILIHFELLLFVAPSEYTQQVAIPASKSINNVHIGTLQTHKMCVNIFVVWEIHCPFFWKVFYSLRYVFSLVCFYCFVLWRITYPNVQSECSSYLLVPQHICFSLKSSSSTFQLWTLCLFLE